MSCTYIYQGKSYKSWEFVDLLASMPVSDVMRYLPEEARAKVAMASYGGWKQTDTPEFKKWFGDWELAAANAVANQQIEEWNANTLKSNVVISAGMPSSILKQFDVPNLPIHLTQRVLKKAIVDKHDVDVADMSNIVLNLQYPIAVFASKKGDGHKVLVTEARHSDGNVIVALELWASRDEISINDITSIHPKRDGSISNWVGEGLLLGFEKTKGREWLENSVRSNFGQPQVMATSSGFIVYDTDRLSNVSKVVGADGKPLVVYHGTKADFSEFDTEWGAYFTPRINYAGKYAVGKQGGNVMPVYLSVQNPAKQSDLSAVVDELKADKPTRTFDNRDYFAALKAKGFDGFIPFGVGGEVIVFDPTQIKSSIGNNGDFDRSNPDIRASVDFSPEDYRGAPDAQTLYPKIKDAIKNLAGKSVDTFNWWHKTVGSQFHKAKIDRHFGAVFNRAQEFIEAVSKYGTEAADFAPSLLPKMDSLAGAMREISNAGRDSKDAKAIAAPIFEGTLYEDANGNTGKVWSDDELRTKYNLNDRQISLYREYRAAVDHSLETLAIAEMNKVARVNKLEPGAENMTMEQLSSFYSNQYEDQLADLHDRIGELESQFKEDVAALGGAGSVSEMGREEYHKNKSKLEARFNAEKAELLAEISPLEAMNKAFKDKTATINKLKSEGYAPLMRFGKYVVDVTESVPSIDDNGHVRFDRETGDMIYEDKRIFFGMFESESEARNVEKVMKEEYPDAKVERGVSSEDGWQLFGATNPASLEMLARLVGSEDEVVQRFYKEAVAGKSAMKRLIHREGIAGYSKDVTRGLASFLLSNARASATADHFGELMQAAEEIPKNKGDVKDEAVKLINYIRNPNEEAGALRGLLFMQFLGGSVASAAVNLTQTMTTTMPYIHQFGGTPKDIVSASILATKRMRGKNADISPELAEALTRAEDDGVVAPHNIHALMGASASQISPLPAWIGGNNPLVNRAWRGASHAWGSMFGMAEQFNRETAFISMFNIAEKMGAAGRRAAYQKQADLAASRGLPPPNPADYASSYAMAKNAVNETQFVLSKAARPNWARGSIGATLFTFKQFSVMYMELLKRLPAKERAMMLGTLILLAGAGGLPGADDLDDLLDTLGQAMGYNTNMRKWKDQAAADVFGKMGGDFVMTGVSAFLPLELSTRLGMGNLIPATGLFKKSSQGKHDRDFQEVLGAAGGYAKQVMDAWDYANQGRYGMALTNALLPKAFKDLSKGIDMAGSGSYDDTHGRRVIETDMGDAFWKAIGFQPSNVSEIQRKKQNEAVDIALVKNVKASIAEMWATGIHDRDPEKSAQARQMLMDWNEKNPEMKLVINPSSVQRRVKEMNSNATERMSKTAPKEMRASVKQALAE